MRNKKQSNIIVGQPAANKALNPHRITMRCLDNQPLALLSVGCQLTSRYV